MKTKQNKRTFSHYNTIYSTWWLLDNFKISPASQQQAETRNNQRAAQRGSCHVYNFPKQAKTEFNTLQYQSHFKPSIKISPVFCFVLAQMLYPDGLQ